MGPFPERKVGQKRFILVVADRLTGFSEARAFKGAGSREIIIGLEHWVRVRGRPKILCADVAQATWSREFRAWCKEKGILQEFSPPYHHSSIGFVEHFNQTLLNQLRRVWAEEPKLFADKVKKAVEIYNHTPRSNMVGSLDNIWHASQKT